MANSTSEQRDKRLSELNTYLFNFQTLLKNKEGVTITYIENAAEIIRDLYFRYADEIVRKSIDSGIIQNFKIAACTELVILLSNPVVHENPSQKKYLTARLALYCAVRIIIEWNQEDVKKYQSMLLTDDDIKDFLDEHFKWLYLLNPSYYNPIFANSQVWRLFYYLLREKSK